MRQSHEILSFPEVAEIFGGESNLHPQVYSAGQRGASGEDWLTAVPHPTYAAVEEAGRLLRHNPADRLAREVVPDETIRQIPPQDIAARSLVQIANTSITRQRSAAISFASKGMCRYYVCDLTERFFASTFNFVATEESFLDNQVLGYTRDGYQIITDQSDQPVLLRKRRGQQTALSLTPLAINGVTYPLGSLVRYDLGRDFDRDPRRPGRYAPEPLQDGQQEVLPLSEISRISFLRLSAFALPPDRRHVFPLQPGDFAPLHEYERHMLKLGFDCLYEFVQDAVQRQVTVQV